MAISLTGNGMVYKQIVDYFIKYISLSIIAPNEKLPSCRALASELGINPNTVEKAYKILEQEGYIIIIEKKGVYAKDVSLSKKDDKVIEQLNEIKASGISKEHLLELIDKIYEKEEKAND